DYPALAKVCDPEQTNLIGISCFAGKAQNGRYITRVFFPWDYVPEDAGCGSAAGLLAAHLLRHRQIDSGQEIVISQGQNVGRPSTLRAMVHGTPAKIDTIRVGGGVRLVGRGEFIVYVLPQRTVGPLACQSFASQRQKTEL